MIFSARKDWFFLRVAVSAVLACLASSTFGLNASIGPDGCNAKQLHALGFTGQGVLVGVFSQAHCRISHEAFFDKDGYGNPVGNSHVQWFDPTGDTIPYEPYWHDTSLAGIIAGRGGALYPTEIGVAPECSILSVKITRISSSDPGTRTLSSNWIQAGLDKLIAQQGRIAVTGIQLNSPADGLSIYTLIYDYYAYTNDILFISAAGNDSAGITVFGDGHNGITTGGLIMPSAGVYRQVGTASNPGPTTDGRRKPDITSPAQTLWVPTSSSDTAWRTEGTTRGETSWAGPHAAGTAALLVQYTNSSAEANDGKSAVIKAVIVNSTFPNIKTKTGQITADQTWNAQRGYGRIDALRAYQLLSRPKIATNTNINQSAGWAYQYLNQNYQQDTFRVYGRINQRLLTTITWHRKINKDMVGNYSEDTPRLNLNLQILDPAGASVFSDSDTINNLRKADVLLQTEGYYQIKIINTTAKKSRYYAMAFELLDPVPGDFNMDYCVDSLDLAPLTEVWLSGDCLNIQQFCYSFDVTGDGIINEQDLNAISTNWLKKDLRYYPLP